MLTIVTSATCVESYGVSRTIVVLHGDQTGEELLQEALRALQAPELGAVVSTVDFDLSLANRRRTKNGVVIEAAAAIREHGFGLKAATITPEVAGDVGSPNAIVRSHVHGKVIVRTGNCIPGVDASARTQSSMSVVRMAVDGAYGAKEWREGEGDEEIAYRTERISRSTCRAVAEYAFVHAGGMGATVFGGPKYTVSPVYEGMLKEEMDAASLRHPAIPYQPQLIDTTYAMVLSHRGGPLVIPALNRDGDCLSDFVMQLYGTLAGSESLLLGFEGTDVTRPNVVMAEAPHGTAPSLEGKNVANPMAMLLATASLLSAMPEREPKEAGTRLRKAVFAAVGEGVRTRDIGGDASTTEFTDVIIAGLGHSLRVTR